jgi:hypothetical protein
MIRNSQTQGLTVINYYFKKNKLISNTKIKAAVNENIIRNVLI